MPQLDIDLSNDNPLSSRELLPGGDYTVIILDSKVKHTKAGDGRYLEITLQVIEGPHKGRFVWDRIGLWYSSEKAREIARRTLRAITDAIGHSPVVANSDSLHNKPLVASVTMKQDEGYGPSNEVKGYKAAGSGASFTPAAGSAQRGARPAWAK